MKINRLETHDRLLEFAKQADYISQGCTDCINNRPEEFGNLPFYIFSHKRTIELDERIGIFNADIWASKTYSDYQRKYGHLYDVPAARIIWEPRLTKPMPQINSMLFKAYPPTDNLKVIWIIPDQELWNQYTEGKLAENRIISESIHDFKYNRNKLSMPEEEDLSDEEINLIYEQISKNAKRKKTGFIL